MENSQGDQKVQWTWPEDKVFEAALVRVPDGMPDRWRCIAEVLPERSPEEVEQHYNDLVDDVLAIGAGLIPLANYSDETPSGDVAAPTARGEAVRKKGEKWTKEEHMLFLLGLEQHGKGEWQKISRNVVLTKTPAQIASHAQKYFIRQNTENKSGRPSIHDITLPASNPAPTSSSMENPNEGVSEGYQNTVGRFNQEGTSGNDNSVPNTNNEPIFPSYQVSNHRGCPSESYVTADGNNRRSFSLARFPSHEGSMGNHHPANVYFQGGSIGCNNGTTLGNEHSVPSSNQIFLENEHSVLSSNQFPLENISNTIDMDCHLISSQSQFTQQCAPIEFCTNNLISHSTTLPTHFQNIDGHTGSQFPNGGGSMWQSAISDTNVLNNFRTVPDQSVFVGNDATNYLNECSVVPYIHLTNDQVNANGTDRSTSPTYRSI